MGGDGRRRRAPTYRRQRPTAGVHKSGIKRGWVDVERGRGGKQEHRPWKSLAHSATSRETVALVKWSLAAASNVKLSEGVSGEKNVLVLFLRPPGHWRHRSLKNFELSERREGSAGALSSSWRAASSAAARAVRGHIFTRVLRTLPAPFRLPGNSSDLHL